MRVLWYAESDEVISLNSFDVLAAFLSFFQKLGKFSQARNFLWVTLNLMNFAYF